MPKKISRRRKTAKTSTTTRKHVGDVLGISRATTRTPAPRGKKGGKSRPRGIELPRARRPESTLPPARVRR